MAGKLWKLLLTEKVLRRGWHMARADIAQDFAEIQFLPDSLAVDLDLVINEIINRLRTRSYQPCTIFRIEVPKGTLGFRPGTVLPIHDRIVLCAIVYLLAEKVDDLLPEAVYSWRLKRPVPKKGPIFKETTILDLPYLKKSTIKRHIDPFEAWYENWPEFDEKSRAAFGEKDFRFLATCDIAAYFENIQLPILRDQLVRLFPSDTDLINLLFTILECWALRTEDGMPLLRGIPQGNAVSSFLGNMFLLRLDDRFTDLKNDRDIEYYRYMDDVRVFARTIEDARVSIFAMDRVLRSLHLNVQTAKTKIYDENYKEISRVLIDKRVDAICALIDEMRAQKDDSGISAEDRKRYLRRLGHLAKATDDGAQAIIGARRPLGGLAVRAFKRWIAAHDFLDSHEYVERLLREIQINPDYSLTRKLVQVARRYPKKRAVETKLFRFIQSDKNIFPHQEAECIRAIRYLSRVSNEIVAHCRERLYNPQNDPYLRIQCAYLLGRTKLTKAQLKKITRLFHDEINTYVKTAIAGLLVQNRDKNAEMVRMLVLHPNQTVRDFGKLLRVTKNDWATAKDRIRHSLGTDPEWNVVDNMPFIHVMSNSRDRKIRKHLVDALKEPSKSHSIVGMRVLLGEIRVRTDQSLDEGRPEPAPDR